MFCQFPQAIKIKEVIGLIGYSSASVDSYEIAIKVDSTLSVIEAHDIMEEIQ